MLDVKKEAAGDNLTFMLEGRLDTTTAPDFEKEVKENTDGVKVLVMDLDKLEYISSAGLRVLLAAQKIMNRQGEMTIKNASDDIKEIFDVTGFSDILTIE